MSELKTGRPSRKEKAINAIRETKSETIRMNVNIPKSLLKQIKQKALDEDTNVSEIVKKLLTMYISK